jgi:hydroxymethylbilane synthase
MGICKYRQDHVALAFGPEDLQTRPIRIGTRGSRLALIQANEARDRLIAAHGLAPEEIEIVTITTTGDRIRDRPLAEIGGKALFAKEIEEALRDGDIDLAVHSMKDMPGDATPGLAIPAFLPREDPRDAFMSRVAGDVMALPHGARLGSSSVRRIAQLKHIRPDLVAAPFRGNVETRLAKLDRGEVDATVLACAGLRRLGLDHEITAAMAPEIMLPAVAQGAIGLQVREIDERMHELVAPLNDAATAHQMAAERAFLIVLEGSCRTPLAGHAVLDGDRVAFRGMALVLDGSEVFEARREGAVGDAAALGREAGEEVRRLAGSKLVV